jgi:hypothetical protein
MGKKAEYVVKISEAYGYYSDKVYWAGVPKEEATRMTHKEARKQADHLRQPKINLPAIIEPV